MSGPPPPRPAAMDPLHITEFASDQYFQKLTQERQQQLHRQQQETDAQGLVASPAAPLPLPSQSKFILPLRDSKTAEVDEAQAQPTEQKQKKSRFGGFSRLLHSSKSQQPQPADPPARPVISAPIPLTESFERLSVGEYVKSKSTAFDELFLGLPTELQIQVIASLPLSDILSLRLASRAWHTMVTVNEGPIVRYQLDHDIPTYAKRLYPPDYSNLNFHYLCGLWHRLHVAAKLSVFICEWVTKEIFLRTTDIQKQEFAPKKERMRRRLIPLLFTIFHFFETYRDRHIQYLIDHDGKGLQQTPYTYNPIEVSIMNMYDDRTLLQVHQVFPLVIASFRRRLRPPSYVGRVERSIRGYIREKPTDDVHVAALCVGGLRQVERFWEIKGYNHRVGAVDNWWQSMVKEPMDTTVKPRRGLMGLGRKKSSVVLRDAAANPMVDSAAPPLPPLPPMFTRRSADSGRYSFIFRTSMSAGKPMGDLSREHLRLLLPDLPILQKLWLATAESLILDRKIVERSADIRRNAQVMLELIREDTDEEEDEWLYGQGGHDSVRPPLDSIEEDPFEEAGHALQPGTSMPLPIMTSAVMPPSDMLPPLPSIPPPNLPPPTSIHPRALPPSTSVFSSNMVHPPLPSMHPPPPLVPPPATSIFSPHMPHPIPHPTYNPNNMPPPGFI